MLPVIAGVVACLFFLRPLIFRPECPVRCRCNEIPKDGRPFAAGPEEFRHLYGCSDSYPQIETDFAPWLQTGARIAEGELGHVFDIERMVRVQVIDQQVFITRAKCRDGACGMYNEHHATGLLDLVMWLLHRTRLRDVDFVVNMMDEPQVLKHETWPVLSVCKTAAHSDILFPDSHFTMDFSSWETNSTWRLDPARLGHGATWTPWERRNETLLWRGSTTGGRYYYGNWRTKPRSKLVLASLNRPDLIDARFTGFHQYDDATKADILDAQGGTGTFIPMHAQLSYKYLASIDGNGYTYRLRNLLLSDSVVFMQQSLFVEWYYYLLEPYVHYVPLREDMADAATQVEWARANDDKARSIAQESTRLIREKLRMEDVHCYMHSLLETYASLQSFKPQPQSGACAVPRCDC